MHQPVGALEQLGGAPSFFVPGDGSAVHDVSWDEYAELEISRCEPAG